MNWAERKQRVKDDILRGQGKHEAMLLKCKLREHRENNTNKFEMKSIDREMKKIESELIKIRHTIRHGRRNSGSLTTRSLTFDNLAPRHRKPRSGRENTLVPLDGVTSPSSKRGSRSRLSVSPSMMASATSLPEIVTTQDYSSLLSLPVPEIVPAPKRAPSQLSQLGVPKLKEIQEEAIIRTNIEGVYPGNNTSLSIPEVDTAQKRDASQMSYSKSVMPRLREIHEGAMNNARTENMFIGNAANLTDHGIPTISISRQQSFIHQSKSNATSRRQGRTRLNALSGGNFKSMRDDIANETLKKFGLG